MASMKKTVFSFLIITLGSACYSLGFVWCYAPNAIAFGGVTGVGQIVNYLIPAFPVGVTVIVLNVPLFLLGWKLLGGGTLISSLYAMFLSSVFTDLFCLYDWPPMDEPLMACIFGGVLMGLSRLYVGVHYPTDVLVGAVIGALCAWVAWKAYQIYEDRRNSVY